MVIIGWRVRKIGCCNYRGNVSMYYSREGIIASDSNTWSIFLGLGILNKLGVKAAERKIKRKSAKC